MAFNMAIADSLIAVNPCKGVELPRPDDDEIHPLTPDQVDTLLTLLDTLDQGHPHRNAALYHVAIRYGLRRCELIGLRWKDIDLERRELRCRPAPTGATGPWQNQASAPCDSTLARCGARAEMA